MNTNKALHTMFLDLLYSIENTKLLYLPADLIFTSYEEISSELKQNLSKYYKKYNHMEFIFNNTMYSFEQVVSSFLQYNENDNMNLNLVDGIIVDLLQNKQIILFPPETTKEQFRVRSRSLELLRMTPYVPFIPDYKLKRNEPLSSIFLDYNFYSNFIFAKRIVEEKKIPPRTIDMEQFKERLKTHPVFMGNCIKGKSIGNEFYHSKDYEIYCHAIDILTDCLRDVFGSDFKLSEFQFEAISHCFFNVQFYSGTCRNCKYKSCYTTENLFLNKYHLGIEAPVGAGKTLAYILGPLLYIIYKKLKPTRKNESYPTCLIIVPRRDLGLDLFQSNIGSLIDALKKYQINIELTLDAFGQDNPLNRNLRYNSDIVITNIESLKLRIQDPDITRKLNVFYMKYIIVDEIHLFDAFLGINTALFLRRLLTLLLYKQKRQLYVPMFIGASATVANLPKHMKSLFPLALIEKKATSFGSKYFRLNHVNAADYATSIQGRINHLFLKPLKNQNKDGALANLISFVLHNWKQQINTDLFLSPEEIDKSLVFVDSKKSIRQTKQFLSQIEKKRITNSKNYVFQSIFDKPVDKLISEKDCNIYSEIPDVCYNCKYGYRDRSIKEWLLFLSKLKYVFNDKEYGVLSDCYFYQKGFCWYFAEYKDFIVKPISEDEWANIDVRRYTADSLLSETRMAEKSLGMSSEMLTNRALDLNSLFKGNKNIRRVMFTTPVFEVGVNLSNVNHIFLLRSINTIVSYKQKVGRGGRDYLSDITALTIISESPKDKQIIRTPEIVANPKFIEPLSIKLRNLKIVEAHVVEAIFDFLVNYKDLTIGSKYPRLVELSKELNQSINKILFSKIVEYKQTLKSVEEQLIEYLLFLFDDLDEVKIKQIVLGFVNNLIQNVDCIFSITDDNIRPKTSLYHVYQNQNIYRKYRQMCDQVDYLRPLSSLVDEIFGELDNE